jgi:hypothetical protein
MARAPELEALLQAWFDLKHCAPTERAAKKRRLDELVNAALTNSGIQSISSRELLMALEEEYREFAKAKYIEERRRLSRLK